MKGAQVLAAVLAMAVAVSNGGRGDGGDGGRGGDHDGKPCLNMTNGTLTNGTRGGCGDGPRGGDHDGDHVVERWGNFCEIANRTGSQLADDTMDNRTRSLNHTGHGDKGSAQEVVRILMLYCTADARDLCGVGPNTTTCAEEYLAECPSCFDLTPHFNASCLCECETTNTNLTQCTPASPSDIGIGAELDKPRGKKGGRGGDGRNSTKLSEAAASLAQVGTCFTNQWASVSSLCQQALTAYANANNYTSPLDPITSTAAQLADAAQEVDADSTGSVPLAAVIGASVGASALLVVAVVLGRKRYLRNKQAKEEYIPSAKLASGKADTVDGEVIIPQL